MIYYGIGAVALIITIVAQILVSVRYSKFKKILNGKKISGFEVAKNILTRHDLDDIYIVETTGELTDHYDPGKKVIRLSHDIFHGESIASCAVASHEVGHAIQYKEGNPLIKIRSFIFPFVSFCSKFGYIVIIFSFIVGQIQFLYLGIIMLAFILLFQLITLPVEFDASKKALIELEKEQILTKEELAGAKEVLSAAALTYVASLATTVLEILRLILLAFDRD